MRCDVLSCGRVKAPSCHSPVPHARWRTCCSTWCCMHSRVCMRQAASACSAACLCTARTAHHTWPQHATWHSPCAQVVRPCPDGDQEDAGRAGGRSHQGEARCCQAHRPLPQGTRQLLPASCRGSCLPSRREGSLPLQHAWAAAVEQDLSAWLYDITAVRCLSASCGSCCSTHWCQSLASRSPPTPAPTHPHPHPRPLQCTNTFVELADSRSQWQYFGSLGSHELYVFKPTLVGGGALQACTCCLARC